MLQGERANLIKPFLTLTFNDKNTNSNEHITLIQYILSESLKKYCYKPQRKLHLPVKVL